MGGNPVSTKFTLLRDKLSPFCDEFKGASHQFNYCKH